MFVEVHEMRHKEDLPKVTLNKIISQWSTRAGAGAPCCSACSHRLTHKVLGSIPRTTREKVELCFLVTVHEFSIYQVSTCKNIIVNMMRILKALQTAQCPMVGQSAGFLHAICWTLLSSEKHLTPNSEKTQTCFIEPKAGKANRRQSRGLLHLVLHLLTVMTGTRLLGWECVDFCFCFSR